jgi:hypothetical protein
MSHLLTEVSTFTQSVTVPDPGDPVLAADLEIVAQALANRTQALNITRAVNWGPARQISPSPYTPIAIAHDAKTGRWYVLHHRASPLGYFVSTSADGITWTDQEHSEPSYQLRALCAGSGLSDGVLVGGANGNITQRVGLVWTDRAVTNLQDCWAIAWDSSGAQFVAVGQDTGNAPGVWTSPDGQTWSQRTIAAAGETEAKAIVISSTGFMVAWTDAEYWTSPDGITWTARGAPPVTPDNVAVTDDGATWMLIGGGAFHLSTDNGVTWGTALATGPDADNDLFGLVALGAAFVGFAPYDGSADSTDLVGYIYVSRDAGATWQRAAPVNRLVMNWFGAAPNRGQLYRTAEGQLALLGVDDNAAAGALYVATSTAVSGTVGS